jgi:hypothetical protein
MGFVLGCIKVQGAPASHALDDRTPTSRRVAADRAINIKFVNGLNHVSLRAYST